MGRRTREAGSARSNRGDADGRSLRLLRLGQREPFPGSGSNDRPGGDGHDEHPPGQAARHARRAHNHGYLYG